VLPRRKREGPLLRRASHLFERVLQADDDSIALFFQHNGQGNVDLLAKLGNKYDMLTDE
jgi:hypothetical protein